tara:strand:- start:548 stop:745 length:198 start_codon:yes stop_codon:yes gene_type:complete
MKTVETKIDKYYSRRWRKNVYQVNQYEYTNKDAVEGDDKKFSVKLLFSKKDIFTKKTAKELANNL